MLENLVISILVLCVVAIIDFAAMDNLSAVICVLGFIYGVVAGNIYVMFD